MSQKIVSTKNRAVGDEDPDYSPMEPAPGAGMTQRGADGRAHKVEELTARPAEKGRRRGLEAMAMIRGLRGSPD